MKFFLYLAKVYGRKRQNFQSGYFLKKALCNCIWVLRAQIASISSASFHRESKAKKIRSTCKFAVLILLNYYVHFLQTGNLEQVPSNRSACTLSN